MKIFSCSSHFRLPRLPKVKSDNQAKELMPATRKNQKRMEKLFSINAKQTIMLFQVMLDVHQRMLMVDHLFL